MKRHVECLQQRSEVDKYVIRNLTWSGIYLSSILSNTLIQKVLMLGPLIETILKVFFATMITFLSDSYDSLEDTLTHMKSFKLKSYLRETLHISALKYW